MRLLAPLLVLVIALVAVLALDESQRMDDVDLVIVNRGDPYTLDPQRITFLRDFRMAAALYEGLVRWNNHDFSIEPAAAEALPVISDDGRTYTFRIAPAPGGPRWSNGDPVTAHDFVFTFRRALLPDTASYYTGLLFAIEGAREFFDWRSEQLAAFAQADSPWRATEGHGGERGQRSEINLWNQTRERFDQTVGIKALDDRTLQITLAQPVPYFLDILAMPIAFPVYERSVAAHQRLDPRTGRLEQRQDWCKPGPTGGGLVTNGPYVLKRWRFKRDMLLVRNPHYHRPEIVMSDSILALTIEDANTAVLAFKARGSRIDWMDEIGVDYAPDMLAQQSELLHTTPAFATEFYGFNCRPQLPGGRENPFADARVRRAFALAVDRKRIVQHVTRLNEPIARTLIPPGSIPGYRSPNGLGFDVQQARRELRDAGWFDRDGSGIITNERGEPFPVVDLLWTTSAARHRWIALEMKAQLEEHLGVRVEIRGLDARFYREDLRRGNFMLARGSWYGDYGDPTTFLDLSRTGDGNNHRRYSNPYVDDLLDQAAAEADAHKRLRFLEEVERFLFDEEVPMLVLFHPVRLSMYDASQLQGVSRHPRAIQHLSQLQN